MTNEAVLIDRDGHPTLRFERRLRAPIDRVWRAVTDEGEMRSWFPSAVQGERKVGAPLSFPFDTNVADAFGGEVVDWEPTRLFAFTWNGDLLRIELTADGDATNLVFTHELYHESAAARTAAGWHACLANLDAHLGGSAAAPDLWRSEYPRYLERMGPSLGTPGPAGSMTWERATHVDPARVRQVASADLEAWGAAGHGDDPVRWDVEATSFGSCYRLVHDTIGTDARLAAEWHALLLQLDMFLAAGQLVEADPDAFVAAYEQIL
ncbi:MAG: hypothetical protein QOI47_2633 [Actinomycetota bacterium]|nr:hypothetical protein [Actinomycetota bacterium]